MKQRQKHEQRIFHPSSFILHPSSFLGRRTKHMAAPNELSFLPDDYLERKQRRRTNAICAVLFGVVISSIGGAFTVTERSMREIEKQYADTEKTYTDAAKRIDQVEQMQEKQPTKAH